MRRPVLGLVALICLAVVLTPGCGSDDDDTFGPEFPTLPPGADMERGGLLWDQWWAITGDPAPSATHPLYPPTGQFSGSTTWRCKECHGWDYLGADGAYGSGLHYTGINGVLDAQGYDVDTLFAILSTAPHDWTAATTEADVWDLVAFLDGGLIDMRRWIDYGTAQAQGNAAAGRPLYDVWCAGCHGLDGRSIDFGGGTGVPDVARGNPWETLHKIRWGQPGTGMQGVVGVGLSTAEQVDVLTYCQALP